MDLTLSGVAEASVDCGTVVVHNNELNLSYRKVLIEKNLEPKEALEIALQYSNSVRDNLAIVFNDGVFLLVYTSINDNLAKFKIDALRHFKDQHTICVWSPEMNHIWVYNRQEKKSRGVML